MAINPKQVPTQVLIKGKDATGKEVPILVKSDGTVLIEGVVKQSDKTKFQAQVDLKEWGGKSLTGRNVTEDLAKLQNLNVLLSSRASEATLAKQPQIPASLIGGEKTVATAGAAEPLGSGSIVNGVLIQAKADNTGKIYIGNSATQKVELDAGESTVVVADNLEDIYINADVSGEGVNYVGG